MWPDSATDREREPDAVEIERLPRCVTSAGTAAARVRVMKSATYAVSDSALRSDMRISPVGTLSYITSVRRSPIARQRI